jgi:ketosteroid isomerase-like protein
VTGLHPTRQPMPDDAAAPAELGLRGVYDAPQPTDQERHVNTHHQIVDRYMDGFRRSDHEAILDCLTEDVVWHIHGLRTTEGKAEFDDEIENPAFEGGPELTVERAFDAGDVVVVAGTGVGHHREAGRFRFALYRPVHVPERPDRAG